MAVRVGAHVRYRRATPPSHRFLVGFPQPASGEVLCRVNPGTSDSVSRACPVQYVLLSSCALSPAERNDGVGCGLFSYVVSASQALSTSNDIIRAKRVSN